MASLLASVGWTGLHPEALYVPLVLMLLGLGLLAFSIFKAKQRLLGIALLIMVLGLTSMYLIALSQGISAFAIPTEEVRDGIDHYRRLVTHAWDALALATVLFGLMWVLHRAFQLRTFELGVLPLVFSLFYGLGLYWLMSAACQGEWIVQESGTGG